jgi:protein-arginine deiminase
MAHRSVFYIKQGDKKRFHLDVSEGFIKKEFMENVALEFYEVRNDGTSGEAEEGEDGIIINGEFNYELVIRPVKGHIRGECKLVNIKKSNGSEIELKRDHIEVYSFPVSLDCDSNRDGDVTDDDDKKTDWTWADSETGGRGDILLVNNDTTIEDSSSQGPIRTKLIVADTTVSSLPFNWTLRLYATPRASQRFSVYSDDKRLVLLGKKKLKKCITVLKYDDTESCFMTFLKCMFKKAGARNLSNPLNHRGQTLWAEAHEFPGPFFEGLITLELQLREEAPNKLPNILASDKVVLRVAPWMMLPNTLPVQKVFSAELTDIDFDNSQFIADLRDQLGDIDVKVIPRGKFKGNRWIQDQIEIGYSESVKGHIHVVLNSPRHPPMLSRLQFWKKEICKSDIGTYKIFRLGGSRKTTSLDSFGNLEVSPPLTDYPFGRIIFGGLEHRDFRVNNPRKMMPELRQFLYAQKVQSPVEIFTDWLTVGHVDEIVSFIPYKERDNNMKKKEPKGFKVLLASPRKARETLDAIPSNKRDAIMFEGKTNRSGDTVQLRVEQILDESNLKMKLFWEINLNVFQTYMDENREILKRELNLDDSDFIDIPVLFEVKSRRPIARTSTIFPNMVNHLVIVKENHETLHLVPKPFGPVIDGKCAFEKAFEDTILGQHQDPEIRFIDDWYPYFTQKGDIHCATNAVRIPPQRPPIIPLRVPSREPRRGDTEIPEKPVKWWHRRPDSGFDI